MTEPSKDKLRIIFRGGGQRKFLEEVGKKLTLKEMAHICACSPRTVYDWRREKFAMSNECAQILSRHAGIPIPATVITRNRYAHTRAAGQKGAQAVQAKYGRVPVDEARRKRAWRTWWQSEGKSAANALLQPRPIRRPKRNLELAEFIGIVMGDGGISDYQAVVTLHDTTDLEYGTFVVRLAEKLFGVRPSVYHHAKYAANNIVISRRELVRFLHRTGLPIGNKVRQQFDIPGWIKKSKKLSVACVRGLVDTDGCVIVHRYRVRAKLYRYKKLSFTSRSRPLQQSVAEILTDLGMHVRIAGYDVRLDSIADMQKYFALIGTHNPKHLKRYRM